MTNFPINGAFKKLVIALIPQRKLELCEQAVHTSPECTFKGLIVHVIKQPKLKWLLFTGALFEAIASGMYTCLPLLISEIVDSTASNNGLIAWGDITQLMMIILCVMTFTGIINLYCVRQTDKAGGIAEALIRRQLTYWALGHSSGWFAVREVGQIAYRVSEVSKHVNFFIHQFAYNITAVISSLIITSVIMFFADLYAAVFFVCWSVIFLVMSLKFGLIAQKFTMHTVRKRTQASGLVTDIIINNSLIRLFSTKHDEDRRLDESSSDVFGRFMESSSWACIQNAIRDIWIIILVIVMIYIFGDGLHSGRITMTGFIASMGVMFVMLTQVRSLHHIIRELIEVSAVIKEGIIDIGLKHDIDENANEKKEELPHKKIVLNRVSFSYGHGIPVIQNIDLRIAANQKIGIVGSSGAGKTTLMALLLRLWDVSEGSITIGDKDIRELSSTTLRNNIALIPQDTTMFHRSLMDNIRYGNINASDEQVIEAAKNAHAHEFINQLPGGYATLVGERGIKLSGGQRQRIAIARAVLKDAPILILDEATSALDSESEKFIQESLHRLMEGKTVIAIAHRLSTICDLDRLIVLKDGKIAEDGAHKELLAQNGYYAKLWKMQSGGFM